MAEVTIYRASVRVGITIEGEVFSFEPIPDRQYSQIPRELGAGTTTEALLMRDSEEIRVVVPDELYESGRPGQPAVRFTPDSATAHYTAWGLVEQARRGGPP